MNKFLSLFLVVCMSALLFACTAPKQTSQTSGEEMVKKEVADQVFYGNIITMDDNNERAEALASKDGIIIYVGTKEGVKEFIDDSTKTFDYGTNTIYPGFLDAHEHGVLHGWRSKDQVQLGEGTSYDDYANIMKKYIEENPGRDYYMGTGWIVFDGINPTHEVLDKVSTEIPVIANSGDGHSMLLNKVAMDICEMSKDMVKDFAPGEIKVDENGEPTGLVSEEPAIWLLNHMPLTMDDIKNYIDSWQNFAFSYGYTGGGEAGTKIFTDLQDDAFIEMDKEKKLKMRTFSYATIQDNTDTAAEDIKKIVDHAKANEVPGGRYKTVGFKAFIDGVLEAGTALMIDEYKDKPGHYGVARFRDHDKMVRLISEASKYNMGVQVHSVGDAASDFMLTCIEDSQKETGNLDQRNACAHLQFVKDGNAERFAKTNTVAVTPPLWIPAPPTDEMNAVEIGHVGKEKAKTDYPIGSFVKAGAHTVFHTDYPAGFVIGIPDMIFVSTKRYNPIAGKATFRGEGETISRKDALKALTTEVAWMFHAEDSLGSLEVGKCADMSVFDTDFLTCPDDKIAGAKVVATVIAGEEVFKK